MSVESSNRLAPPGSGLPTLEKLFGRLLLALHRTINSDEQALREFEARSQSICTLYQAIPANKRELPVLIPRITGIEDSSRNWSAAGVLEHLAIVHIGIIGILKALKAEEKQRKLETSEVKPAGLKAEEAHTAFLQSVKEYGSYISESTPFNSNHTHKHPWFGPFTSHAWHCLAAVHLKIHKKQLELIAQSLSADKPS